MGICGSNAQAKVRNSEVQQAFENDLCKEYRIGRGAYGDVIKAKSRSNDQLFAVKEMKKSLIIAKECVEKILLEKNLLAGLKHDFITNLYYAFQDNDKLYMVLELSLGADLRYHLYKSKVFNEIETSKPIIFIF